MAGVPENVVHDALSINLNSKELSRGLIDYWKYKEAGDPMSSILIGDLLDYVRDEYDRGEAAVFLLSRPV
jgi:hypothetical protein